MLKVSDIRGFLIGLLIVAAVGAVVVWRVLPGRSAQTPPQAAAAPARDTPGGPPPAGCDAPQWRAAASANQASLYALAWSPFGPAEAGWATYAPLISREIGSPCPADSPGFAARYARWQAGAKLPVDGIFKATDFDRIRDALALRRPFVQQTSKGLCPAAPNEATLASARADESYGGKAIKLRPGALEAYRRMVAAARADGVATRPSSFQIASGYRGPAEEAARCAGGGCNTLTRAHCSAHRTGLAVDLYLPPAPGADPISTEDANRRHLAGTVEYRWLLANAARFGFLPYAYEPWHWEWTGEAP